MSTDNSTHDNGPGGIAVNATIGTTAASEIDCLEEFPTDLLYHIAVGPALLCILVLCFLQKRRFLCPDKCQGRPAIQYPVNFIDEREMRWAYAAAFGLLGNTIGNMFLGLFLWMPAIFKAGSEVYDEQFVIDFGWLRVFITMVNVIEVSVMYYPLFACISARKHIIANIFGIIFSLYWFAIPVTILALCPMKKDADGDELSGLMLILMTIPNVICPLPLVLCYILSLYHNIREIIDNRNRRLSVLLNVTNIGTIAKDVADPVSVTQPDYIQYLKELFQRKEICESASVFQRLKEQLYYRKIQGFNYSPRVVCTMFTAALILYKFMLYIVLVLETLLRSMDAWVDQIQVTEMTEEVRQIIVMIFHINVLKDVNFIFHLAYIIRVEIYCSLFIALAIQVFNMIHMVFCYRKHLLNLYRGDRSGMFQNLGSPAAVVVNSLRYSGYQIAYIGWGYLVLAFVLFILMFFFTFLIIHPLMYGYTTFLSKKLKTIGAVIVISVLLYIGQLLLAKFVFLKDRGLYLALTNRHLFHLLNFFMFTFNVIVGLFSCLKRILFSLGFGVIMLGRLDRSSIMRDWERFDVGYKAYLGMLELDVAHNHPVLRAFIHIIQHQAAKRRLAKNVLGDVDKKPKLWPRNKWHLAVTLMSNRSLTVDRILQLQRMEIDICGTQNSNHVTSIQHDGTIGNNVSSAIKYVTEEAKTLELEGYVNEGTRYNDDIVTVTDAISRVSKQQPQQHQQQAWMGVNLQDEEHIVDFKVDEGRDATEQTCF